MSAEQQQGIDVTNHQPNKFDIIRSDSKDKYYKSKQLALIKSVLTSTPLIRINSDQCRLISDCLYYALTTLLSRQTLGEECYYLVECKQPPSVPTLLQRVVMVALKVYVPYITRRISGLKLLRQFLIFFHKLNELVFLWSRKLTYHNLENRFTRISYLSLIPNSPNESSLTVIAALKTINLAIFGANLARQLKRENSKSKLKPVRDIDADTNTSVSTDSVVAQTSSDANNKCSICLEIIKNATLTTCGHLFCWQCVQNYALNVNNSTAAFNCPTCRVLVKSDKLIFLHNF